ncbi:hypothetical protein ACSQ67_022439 [Phaseolus vulgaris]
MSLYRDKKSFLAIEVILNALMCPAHTLDRSCCGPFMLQPSNGYAMLLCLVKNQTAIRTSVANIQRCATAPFCSLSQFQIMIKAEQK